MSDSVFLEVPKDVLDSARLTAPELMLELSLALYASGRLSIGKARELTGMTLWEFRQVASSRRVPAHYDLEDFQDDLAVVKEL